MKSVYELRQSHAAFVSRPISSQPFQARRNVQSAVARRPQQMAFGGYMIPNMTAEQAMTLEEEKRINELE